MADSPSTPNAGQTSGQVTAQVGALLARAAQLEQQEQERALSLIHEAVALARQQGDSAGGARGLLQLATLEWRLSHFADALAHATGALTAFRRLGDRNHEAWSLRLLGNIHGVQGHYPPASEYLQAAAALSRETGNRACLASCLNNLGIIANELGDYAAALEFLLEALTTYAPGDGHIPSTLNNVASLSRQLGQYGRALDHHGQTLELARRTPEHALIATFLHNMAETLRQQGRQAEALPLLQESLTLARQVGDRQTELLALDGLGLTYQALGDVPLAAQCYDQGLRLAETVKHPLAEVKLLMHHGALLSGGREALERALRLALETNLRAEVLEVHDLLAAAQRQAGNFELALHHLEQARRVERELFNEAQDRRVQALQIQYDVARARELAESQQALNEQLRHANEELDAFSYTISHDLRAPVRQIQGFVGLLRGALETDGNPRAERFLGIIEESTERLNTLIDVMLNFARQAREPLRTRPVDLNALVQAIRADLTGELQGRSVVWQVGALPLVQGDPALLRQVFVNLLSNALKYTRPRDEAVIEVRAERRDAQWVVEVRDNGVGFDPRYAGKLFGVFQRLHRADEFEGTGVGLATVQRIVARHGGHVSATSQPGQGATFSVTLPA